VIESAGSATGKAHVIKSHHNVGGLPKDMALELVEPLRELFKDEVRSVGRELGLPGPMVDRHPFPGPGLGVRILGEVTKPAADILRAADHIFIEELRRHDLYHQVSQAFAVFLPVKSVGYKTKCTASTCRLSVEEAANSFPIRHRVTNGRTVNTLEKKLGITRNEIKNLPHRHGLKYSVVRSGNGRGNWYLSQETLRWCRGRGFTIVS